ncbi:TPM domain-containing protein [Sphingomonas sp. LHG3406-1]|uniref:TPM domain-containing protein n=1 Tax=Sphingomonas sp. LHG3406-1 TaxID=2804617 RepID=UPI002616DBCC|nr:TPM domain-containing protein [Sphingomonas sp. LHG3406-1]
MLGTLLVAGCGGERDGATPAVGVGERSSPNDGGGRIIDLAGVLTPAEKLALDRRVAHERQADGRAVLFIVLKADEAQSLEQVGWAVGRSIGASRPIIVLIDPASRQVRVEGDIRLEDKAAVAAAMRDDLATGKIAQAVDRGLTRLEQRAP